MRRWALLPLAALMTRADVPDERFRAFAASPELSPLVRVTPRRAGAGTGSGTLLAGGLVLTAAHVVEKFAPESLQILVGGRPFRVASWSTHPQWKSPARVDLAIVRLAEVPDHPVAELAGVAPALPARAVLAGFGIGGPTRRDSAGTARAGENMVDQRGGLGPGREGDDLLSGDFDAPGHGAKNASGDSLPLPLEVLFTGGDSGGPLFVTDGGRLRLLGVYSTTAYRLDSWEGGQPTYAGSRFAVTDLTRHRDWLAAQGVRLPPGRP